VWIHGTPLVIKKKPWVGRPQKRSWKIEDCGPYVTTTRELKKGKAGREA